MKQSSLISFFIAGILLTASLSFAAEGKPVEVKKTDKCQVCGMFVAKYKEWIAQIIFTDGTYAVFDGPKDMFRYYFNPQKYNPSKKQADIQTIYATEYYSTKSMDARKMFYVAGSEVTGPMGAELVPLESEQKAKEFMKDHNGKKILKFSEITPEVLD
ncbi:MAG: nitrous oxide reductase accessory protein NosL [Thermodesulfovibrionales bacterium]